VGKGGEGFGGWECRKKFEKSFTFYEKVFFFSLKKVILKIF